MERVISDETVEYLSVLSGLSISESEKERVKKDIGEILDYMDRLGELDTAGIEPMSHVLPTRNVFREDVIINGDGREDTLANAPEKRGGGFAVPRTIR